MERGFPIFLAHVTTKEVEDKSEKKRLEDVPIVQDFPEVFPEDLSGLHSGLGSSGVSLLIWKRKISSILRRFKEGFGRCVDAKEKAKGKANVVADALSRKERETTVKSSSLRNIRRGDVGGMLIDNAKFPEAIREQKFRTSCGMDPMHQWAGVGYLVMEITEL
ncbi:hypothetical protein Tco_1228845 [Tanacetum coccineum]